MKSTEYYEDGQVLKIFKYIHTDVDCFIVGGTADANEGQVFKLAFSNVDVYGYEPNKVMYQFQLDNNFPGILSNKGLYKEITKVEFIVPNNNNRCGTLYYATDGDKSIIETTTLDTDFLSSRYSSIVLWIDIEGSELDCLKGARELLESKRIKLLNIETNEMTRPLLTNYLADYDYRQVLEWNIRHTQNDCSISDIIFIR